LNEWLWPVGGEKPALILRAELVEEAIQLFRVLADNKHGNSISGFI